MYTYIACFASEYLHGGKERALHILREIEAKEALERFAVWKAFCVKKKALESFLTSLQNRIEKVKRSVFVKVFAFAMNHQRRLRFAEVTLEKQSEKLREILEVEKCNSWTLKKALQKVSKETDCLAERLCALQVNEVCFLKAL